MEVPVEAEAEPEEDTSSWETVWHGTRRARVDSILDAFRCSRFRNDPALRRIARLTDDERSVPIELLRLGLSEDLRYIPPMIDQALQSRCCRIWRHSLSAGWPQMQFTRWLRSS